MKKTTNKNPIAKYVEKKGTTNQLPTYDDIDESVEQIKGWNRHGENKTDWCKVFARVLIGVLSFIP